MADFQGHGAFVDAIRQGIVQALQTRARDIALVDPDLDRWPLDDPDLLEDLSAFARLPARRLLVLAASYDGVRQTLPRFTRWRATWSHAVDARCPEEPQRPLPSALLVDHARAVVLRDRELWAGAVLDGGAAVHQLRDSFDAQMQRGTPCFAATVLGL
ncbi:MAG: hypothetical protein JNJ71_00285 [Rubrivivax sp.]|nr:hypothetical protein [Rubrivivax sp.]